MLSLRDLARTLRADLAPLGWARQVLTTLRARPCANLAPLGLWLARPCARCLARKISATLHARPCANLAPLGFCLAQPCAARRYFLITCLFILVRNYEHQLSSIFCHFPLCKLIHLPKSYFNLLTGSATVSNKIASIGLAEV